MKQRQALFPCGDLTLEGRCYFPDGSGKFPGVVLCHPHPLHGGAMDNNVVMGLALHLADHGIISFVFNFRGVGQSQGSFGNGIGEVDDAKAAINWLTAQPETDADKISIAGYSFGASVALTAACGDGRVKGVALISPALHEQHIPQIKRCTTPKLIISGSEDDIIPPESVERMQREAAEPKEYFLVDGADHFWWGQPEMNMVDKTVTFFINLFAVK